MPQVETGAGRRHNLGILFLHALPFDASMWADCMGILPEASHAPNLYDLGTSIGDWAKGALLCSPEEKLIVVGCSVGGSCAIEVAALAPDRVAALVLIGTKADHRPDAAFRQAAITLIKEQGLETAWEQYWVPLFSDSVSTAVLETAKRAALNVGASAISNGISVFHSRPSRGQFLERFSHPVIVISGDEDVAPGPGACAAIAASAPQGHLHIVPSCGHYVPLERPDVVQAVLTEMIETLDGPA